MSAVTVHPLAQVEAGAKLGNGVKIGPFCHVGADVVLDDHVELISHVSVSGATTIGAGTKIYPNASLGGAPQNTSHKGGRTTLTIGRNCVIRECVTVHVGSDNSRGATSIGNNCMLMAYVHVAHDCIVGNNVTFANAAMLAGHVEVDDGVIFGGQSGVHQFVRIGKNAFIGGQAGVARDVIPYAMVIGSRGGLKGLNMVGLKRAGVTKSQLHGLRDAYRQLFDPSRTLTENVEQVRSRFGELPQVADILAFMGDVGRRKFLIPLELGAVDATE